MGFFRAKIPTFCCQYRRDIQTHPPFPQAAVRPHARKDNVAVSGRKLCTEITPIITTYLFFPVLSFKTLHVVKYVNSFSGTSCY